MIGFIVDNLHVSTTDKHLLRILWDRLRKNPSNFLPEKKQARKDLYRDALQRHHDNQQLYIDVMTGNL